MSTSSNLKSRKQPSRILVAADGSDTSMNAAEYAITLAKNYNDDDNGNNEAVQVFVINVIDLQPIFKMLPSDTRKQLIRIGRQQARQIFDTVEELATRHGGAKFKINTEMVETSSASAADEIIKYAKEKAIDLIVVGTKGRSGMTKALLGSVASKVVTYSPCPVLVVR
jgi:nucleotide-binding universal stress UspA family protein